MQAIHHRIPLQVGVLEVRVTEVEEAGLDVLLEVLMIVVEEEVVAEVAAVEEDDYVLFASSFAFDNGGKSSIARFMFALSNSKSP